MSWSSRSDSRSTRSSCSAVLPGSCRARPIAISMRARGERSSCEMSRSSRWRAAISEPRRSAIESNSRPSAPSSSLRRRHLGAGARVHVAGGQRVCRGLQTPHRCADRAREQVGNEAAHRQRYAQQHRANPPGEGRRERASLRWRVEHHAKHRAVFGAQDGGRPALLLAEAEERSRSRRRKHARPGPPNRGRSPPRAGRRAGTDLDGRRRPVAAKARPPALARLIARRRDRSAHWRLPSEARPRPIAQDHRPAAARPAHRWPACAGARQAPGGCPSSRSLSRSRRMKRRRKSGTACPRISFPVESMMSVR